MWLKVVSVKYELYQRSDTHKLYFDASYVLPDSDLAELDLFKWFSFFSAYKLLQLSK